MQRIAKHRKKGELVDEKSKIEAYGVKGMKSTSWRKVFKDHAAMLKWVDANSAVVYGTREVEGKQS